MSFGSEPAGPSFAHCPPVGASRRQRLARGSRPTVTATTLQEGLERVYQDRTLTCRDCAEEFIFSAGEQAFFASKGLINDPQRCPSCRAVAKRARTDRRTTRVPRRDLRGLRGPGRRAVRATQRPTRLLQHLLRQGAGRDAARRRPASDPSSRRASHEAGPATGRPRVIPMAGPRRRPQSTTPRRSADGRHHHPRDGRHEPAVVERRRAPGGRDRLEDGPQHPDRRGREVDARSSATARSSSTASRSRSASNTRAESPSRRLSNAVAAVSRSLSALAGLGVALAGVGDEPRLPLLEPELDLAGRAVAVLGELEVDDLAVRVLLLAGRAPCRATGT